MSRTKLLSSTTHRETEASMNVRIAMAGTSDDHQAQFECRLLVSEQRGPSAAPTSELLLLLNSDTIVSRKRDRSPDCSRCTSFLVRSVVGPKIVDGKGPGGTVIRPHDDAFRRVAAEAARALCVAAHCFRGVDVRDAAGGLGDGRVHARATKDAEAAGLFDERYFMYCEDVDFCAAVRANGGKIYFTPVAQIVHLRGRSWRSGPGATADSYRRSHLAFYRKHHPCAGAASESLPGPPGKLPGKTADN